MAVRSAPGGGGCWREGRGTTGWVKESLDPRPHRGRAYPHTKVEAKGDHPEKRKVLAYEEATLAKNKNFDP